MRFTLALALALIDEKRRMFALRSMSFSSVVLATLASSIVAVVPQTVAVAQSRLPQCPSDTKVVWTNCQGTFTFADGTKYVGGWEDGRFHGQGTYTYGDGSKYVGGWEDGRFQGKGTLMDADGSTKLSGIWIDNTFVEGVGNQTRTLSFGEGVAQESNQTRTLSATSVPMVREGGVYVVPVLINNAITLNFVVDSGATDVSVPADVVSTLMRMGALKGSDFLGQKTYVIADGSKVPSQTFRIRSLKVGGKVVQNVSGSVASAKGDLLLGLSFLGRFKSWSVVTAPTPWCLNESRAASLYPAVHRTMRITAPAVYRPPRARSLLSMREPPYAASFPM
jgi:hypothetical protein